MSPRERVEFSMCKEETERDLNWPHSRNSWSMAQGALATHFTALVLTVCPVLVLVTLTSTSAGVRGRGEDRVGAGRTRLGVLEFLQAMHFQLQRVEGRFILHGVH